LTHKNGLKNTGTGTRTFIIRLSIFLFSWGLRYRQGRIKWTRGPGQSRDQ